MSRLAIPTRDDAPAASQPVLDVINQQLGTVPNLFRLLALSPASLAGQTGLAAGLAKEIDLKTRARIAMAVAQVNGCDYCLSAHTYIGLNLAKIAPDELDRARRGEASDPKADAAVHFARVVTEKRGQVSDAELQAVRDAGFSDGQIVALVGLVIENTFTNFVNNVADTDIDFPVVRARELA